MRSELSRRLSHGFVLTEQELRRILDLVLEQFKKVGLQGAPVVGLLVKHRNGAITNPSNLDEIVSHENFGSSAVERLELEVSDKGDAPSTHIHVSFTAWGPGDDDEAGVGYRIHGLERDWVFITGSLLDERIAKVKRFAIRGFREALMLLMTGGLLLYMGMTFYGMASRAAARSSTTVVDTLEARWKAGELKDPIEAIVLLERDRKAQEDAALQGFRGGWPFAVSALFAVSAILAIGSISYPRQTYALVFYFYPPYNFCWGEYLEKFKRRQARARFLMVVVVLALIITIAGNYVSRRLGF